MVLEIKTLKRKKKAAGEVGFPIASLIATKVSFSQPCILGDLELLTGFRVEHFQREFVYLIVRN